MGRQKRIAFVTIGQAPRVDLVPEILSQLKGPIEAREFGVLDDLDSDQIAAMAPPSGEASLCTRLRDGREVVIGKRQTRDRLQTLLNRLDNEGFDAIALLCTGYFDHLSSRTLLIEAQRVVDATVDALSLGCRHLGVIVPLERQIDEFHVSSDAERRVSVAHYSPYSGDRLPAAAQELMACDLVVMHCMGYSEAMRTRAADVIDCPVLLARRIVASCLQQII